MSALRPNSRHSLFDGYGILIEAAYVWRSLGETKGALKNTYKTGTTQLSCRASDTTWDTTSKYGLIHRLLGSKRQPIVVACAASIHTGALQGRATSRFLERPDRLIHSCLCS